MDRGHLIDNCRLLRNLNTYIDEDRLKRSISELRKQVNQIESASGRSRRTLLLRNEIALLEDQIAYGKNQVKRLTRQYYKTKSEDLD